MRVQPSEPTLLLVDPRATGAFFQQTPDVALAESRVVFPDSEPHITTRGPLTFVSLNLNPDDRTRALRLSFCQAAFLETDGRLTVVEALPGFRFSPALVWGTKYRGKTHELVTQLAINLALAHCQCEPTALLDPMAGRGTTLLWAARYGLDAVGIEQTPDARGHFERDLKRQTKLQRLEHTWHRGSTLKKGRSDAGRFDECRFRDGPTVRLLTGDSAEAPALLQKRRFPLIVSDLPYGVQFKGKTRRSPIDTLRACADGWIQSLAPGGAMVLVYNRLQPHRDALARLFDRLTVQDVQLPHRMSESIERDVLVVSA